MTVDVTLSLPDEVYRHAEQLAQLTGRELPAILADTLTVSLSLLGAAEPSAPLSGASDREVLERSELAMDPAQDQRVSVLLDRQQAGELRAGERVELMALMQVVQEGMLRKAQALREAVERGLHRPLDP